MTLHKVQQFKHLTKAEMDEGLKLHKLSTDSPSQLSDAFRLGADWAMRQKATCSSVELVKVEEHVLYKTSDLDKPEVITDCNGEVVLDLCRKCGKAEVELSGPCTGKSPIYLLVRDETSQVPTVLPKDVELALAICKEAIHRWGHISVVSGSLAFKAQFSSGPWEEQRFLQRLKRELEAYYKE